jgi:hypothetical protein
MSWLNSLSGFWAKARAVRLGVSVRKTERATIVRREARAWKILMFVDMRIVEEYHCGTSRESIEWRRVPQVRCLNLGLGLTFLSVGFAVPAGLRRYYGKGHLHFITFSCYRGLPLLKTVRARDVFVKELGKVREIGRGAVGGFTGEERGLEAIDVEE